MQLGYTMLCEQTARAKGSATWPAVTGAPLVR